MLRQAWLRKARGDLPNARGDLPNARGSEVVCLHLGGHALPVEYDDGSHAYCPQITEPLQQYVGDTAHDEIWQPDVWRVAVCRQWGCVPHQVAKGSRNVSLRRRQHLESNLEHPGQAIRA